MTKKGAEKPKRDITRRQQSRWQQEARRHRIILFSGIAIVIGVILTVSIGWFLTEYRPMRETVITVNDTKYDLGYYTNALKLYGKGQPPQYLYLLAGQVAAIIERDQLVKEGAEKLGITVSDDDIRSELKKRNLGNEYWDSVRGQLYTQKMLEEYFDPKVSQAAEQRNTVAMFLGNRELAEQIEARLAKGEDFGELAGEYSRDFTTKENSGALGWHGQGIVTSLLGSSVVDDYAFGNRAGSLSPPIRDDEKLKDEGYWLINIVETKADPQQVHAQAILLGSAEEANNVKARLAGGEDIDTVAKEVSQYAGASETGGDLGWLSPGLMGKAFEDYAFAATTETGKVSDPIRDDTVSTKGGYWLVKVVEAESDRPLSDDDRAQLKARAFDEWVAELFADPDNHIDDSLLTQEKMFYAISKVTGV